MSDQLIQLFTQQFTSNLQLLLQQLTAMFTPYVDRGSHVGKLASPVNQLGPVQMKAPAGRFAPLDRQDPTMTRRWVQPVDKEGTILIDNFDKLKTIIDPQSGEVQAFMAGVAREYDDRIIAAFFADALTGVDSGALVTEQFPATASTAGGYTVAIGFGASGNTGLTVAKLIEGKRVLRHNHNDFDADQICVGIGSQQEADLLSQAQVTSTDFNDKPVLVDGKITRFLGLTFVYSERMTWASNVRSIPMWAKSGMHLGDWQDPKVNITQRTDLSSQPWQIYVGMSSGATRTQLGKVIKINCVDTVGNDITP